MQCYMQYLAPMKRGSMSFANDQVFVQHVACTHARDLWEWWYARSLLERNQQSILKQASRLCTVLLQT